jgi:23S rRNA (cytidine1920-2'-O)/16S rRNA (cytidine1409-2'-O)-methyltransferase
VEEKITKVKIGKERLDIMVVNSGMADTRTKAQNLIQEGKIFVNGIREDKPGTMIKIDALIELKGEVQKYVSRGGYKLEKAIDVWNLDLNNKICMDIGSSTGGFTDCMLQNGAVKVYAIDVGTNQLDWKLRNDNRVVSLEKTNARNIDKTTVNNDKIDFVSMDVSFISITKILDAIYNIIDEDTVFISLLKPQFEAKKEDVQKGGIITDENMHKEIILNVLNYAVSNKFDIIDLNYSPIKGPSGNIEFLVNLRKSEHPKIFGMDDIGQIKEYINNIVTLSHKELDL